MGLNVHIHIQGYLGVSSLYTISVNNNHGGRRIMEKIILIMFHALFGGAAVLLGGFIGYILTMRLTGNSEILPMIGFGFAAIISMLAYIRMHKTPRRRAVL